MRKIIFMFVILVASFQILLSQSYQTIYTANYLITKFYKFKFYNNPVKKIFFQEQGLTGDPCPYDPVGFHTFQINKSTYQTYKPFNGFLDRFQCEVYISGCDRHAVDFFTISHSDSNLIIKYMNYAGAPSPQCAAFIRSNITTNGGVSSATIFYNQVLYGCDINPANDNIIYAGVEDYIYKSTNRGNNWVVVSTLTDLNGIVKINSLRTNDIFAAGTNSMFLSTNGGSNFITLNVPPFKEIAFNETDSSIYGITSSSVYKSLNNGLNWTHIASLPLINTIELNPDVPNIVYIGTENKVYRSVTGGLTFNHSNLTLPTSNKIRGISKDAGSGDTIYICTDKGIYKVWDLMTGLNNISNAVPDGFKLHQNYPNPFNPSTKIKFDIPTTSYIKLIIQDILGKEVVVLVNENLNAGSYAIDWNASTYPSGVFFYRLESNDYKETKRMVLFK